MGMTIVLLLHLMSTVFFVNVHYFYDITKCLPLQNFVTISAAIYAMSTSENTYISDTFINSVYLRPGSDCLARARLTPSYRVYRSWLRSISACAVTSYRIEHVQTTALGPHSCRLELNISSKSRPGLFYPTFRRSDSKKVIVGMDFEDLSEGLRISLFVLNLHAED